MYCIVCSVLPVSGVSDFFLPASLSPRGFAAYSTALQWASIYWTALQCTAVHYTALHFTLLHCTSTYCTALHCTALPCTALHCTDFLAGKQGYTSQAHQSEDSSVQCRIIAFWEHFFYIYFLLCIILLSCVLKLELKGTYQIPINTCITSIPTTHKACWLKKEPY